jgi:dihydropteroate synthase
VGTLRDPALARLVAAHGASLIVMASPEPAADVAGDTAGGAEPARGERHGQARRTREAGRRRGAGRFRHGRPRAVSPVAVVRGLLAGGLRRAAAAGIPRRRIVVDPGIGFFRDAGVPWHEWDARVLAGLAGLRALGRPLAIGVSRKSFIGEILGRRDPGDRLAGSLAATAIAVAAGAAVVRTHDVAETRDAVRVAERLGGRRR